MKMIQNSSISDMFTQINVIFIGILVIALIFFIIVILIVYKLIHSNVNDVRKRNDKVKKILAKNTLNPPSHTDLEEKTLYKESLTCRYCGERIQEKVNFCPLCGSYLK